MQASVLDIGRLSRVARIGCLKQLPVVATVSANNTRQFLSDGNKRIISFASGASGAIGRHRQSGPTSRDVQNDPLAGVRGDAIVLERNIVNRTRSVARDGSKALARSRARSNPALEQSLE